MTVEIFAFYLGIYEKKNKPFMSPLHIGVTFASLC